ncbi:hypothetical protein N9980_01955, partial [bacterium]|nr:hypothetical protein [bacterium]
IPWDDSDAIESEIKRCHLEVPNRFSASGSIAWLKMDCCRQAEAGHWSFFTLSTEQGRPVGYYILRKNWQVTPLRGRYQGFWRVTLMDYGFSSNGAEHYDLLVKEIVFRFSESGADWLDVVSSEEETIRAFRKALLVQVGDGMSFTFVCPKEWDLPASSGQIENWHLNHSSGDGFLF